MRFRIILSILFLLLVGGVYVFSFLPFFTDTEFYQEYIVEYIPFLRKIFSVVMIGISAYGASVALNLVLTRSFTTVIRSNALAKKIFPLFHWAINIAIWIVVGISVLGMLGVNLGALLTGAGIGGVIFALASKEFIANLFGSLSLIFSKNFKIGDTIKIRTFEGTVEEITLSYTRLVDRKGTVIFMPNKLIVSETVENLSMAPMKRADFTCEIPVHDGKKLSKILETTEKEIQKLDENDVRITSHIDGLTEKGYTVTFKIETISGDMNSLKKNIWMILWKIRSEK